MLNLPNWTRGELWLERREKQYAEFELDIDPSHDPKLPPLLPPITKMIYYKMKLQAAFAVEGYFENVDEQYDIIAVFKMYATDLREGIESANKRKRRKR